MVGVGDHNSRREVANVINNFKQVTVSSRDDDFQVKVHCSSSRVQNRQYPIVYSRHIMRTSARFLENLCRSRGEDPKQVRRTLYEGELMTSTAVAECYSLSIGSIVYITDQ